MLVSNGKDLIPKLFVYLFQRVKLIVEIASLLRKAVHCATLQKIIESTIT